MQISHQSWTMLNSLQIIYANQKSGSMLRQPKDIQIRIRVGACSHDQQICKLEVRVELVLV